MTEIITFFVGTICSLTGFWCAPVASEPMNFGAQPALTVSQGGTGTSTMNRSQLLYGAGTSTIKNVATTSLTISSPLTTAGTAGALVGGSNLTIDIDDIKAADLDLVDITLNDFTNDSGFLTTRNWNVVGGTSFLQPSTTIGLIVNASSTFNNSLYVASTLKALTLRPTSNGSGSIGGAGETFSGLYLTQTAPIDFGGDMSITGGTDLLDIAGGSLRIGASGNLSLASTNGTFEINSAGVRLSTDNDGALTILGLGDGSDEDLTLNLDDTANTAVWGTGTGVVNVDWSAIAKSTFANSSTTRASSDYASSTLYFGAGLANCNTENMLTWTDGRFGCESDTSGGGGIGDPFTHPNNLTSATTSLMLFNGGASTTLFSSLGPSYFGATATSSFSTAGALTLITPLLVASGGTGAATLTGILEGNGTGAVTANDSSTAGQILRVTGASAFGFGALDLADTDAITNDLPFANLTQVSANSVLGNVTGATADAASVATSSLFAGTNGQVLARSGGTWVGIATTTFSTGLTYLNGAVTCDTASGSVFGCLSSANWTTFNSKLGSYDAWTHPSFDLSATTSQLLIGTTTASNYELTIASTTAPQLSLSHGTGIAQWTMRNAGGNLYFSTTTVAGTATSTPAAISVMNSGYGLFVGTTTNGAVTGLAVEGTVVLGGLTQATAGTAADLCIIAGTNNLVEESTGACIVSSRLFKHSILPLDADALSIISKLRPTTFVMNGDETETRKSGFIAEEAYDVYPQLALKGSKGEVRSLDDHAFLAVLWKGLKEMISWNERQDTRLNVIEARLNALENENKQWREANQCNL